MLSTRLYLCVTVLCAVSFGTTEADDEDEIAVEDITEVEPRVTDAELKQSSSSVAKGVGLPRPAGDAAEIFATEFLPWMQAGIAKAGLMDDLPPLSETFELRQGRFGNTLFSKRRLERGDILAVIPPTRFKKGSGHSLAVFLAKQRAKGLKSTFAPYISLLPTQYDNLPSNWDGGFLVEHMPGSGFVQHVDHHLQQVKAEYDTFPTGNVAWEDYQWGRDAASTRTMAAAKTNTGAGSSMFFPLGDLMNHADRKNVKCTLETLDGGAEVLVFTAVRRIRAGDELLNAYIHFQSLPTTNTWQSLDSWGFVSPKTRLVQRTGQLKVTTATLAAAHAVVYGGAAIKAQPRRFTLSDGDMKQDSGLVQYLRDAVSDQFEQNSWEQEAAAMMLGKLLLKQALMEFPTTAAEDDVILAAGHADSRVSEIIALRRDEKAVLQWWQSRLQEAEEHARASTGELDLDYMYLPLFGIWDGIFVSAMLCADTIMSDFDDATEQPVELTLLIFCAHICVLFCYCALRLLLDKCCHVPAPNYMALVAVSVPWYLLWTLVFVLEETQLLYTRADHRPFVEKLFVILGYVLQHDGMVVWLGGILQLFLTIWSGRRLESMFKKPKKKQKKSAATETSETSEKKKA